MTSTSVLGQYRLNVETHGIIQFDVQPTNGRHCHQYTEICLVLEGSGRYIHGTGEYLLQPGDVFTADPDVIHEISSHATRDLKLWFLNLDFHRLGNQAESLEDEVVAAYLSRHQTHVRGQLPLRHYLPLIDDQAEGLERASAVSAAKFLALGMLKALAEVTVGSGREASLVDPVDRALGYIDSHLERMVGVEEVAASVGLSPRALRRKFVARLGVGVAEEINQRRMRRAAHLLLMGFGAGEAGRMVGIVDAAQFTRAFRRALGETPKAFQATYIPGRLTRAEPQG